MIERVVLIKLEKPYATPEQRAQIAAATASTLPKAEGVRALRIGTPADGRTRREARRPCSSRSCSNPRRHPSHPRRRCLHPPVRHSRLFSICAACACSMVMLASGSDVARAGTAGLMAAPSKIPIPKVKKKQKVKLGGIPSKSADVGAVAKYEASKSLLASPSPKVKAALGSIEGAGETNRSASAIEGVPVPSDLSPLRSLAIT